MTSNVLDQVENRRPDVIANLHSDAKGINGQFMTAASIARFMANMFDEVKIHDIHLLDPGAGAGSLCAAFIERLLKTTDLQKIVRVSAFEIEPFLLSELSETAHACVKAFGETQMQLYFDIQNDDFILEGCKLLRRDLFSNNSSPEIYSHAILNPPYRKIHSQSKYRHALRSVGIETSNLYTAFLAISLKLLKPGGELVAITPRSFCNGPYFLPFRKLLFSVASLRKIHVFHSRKNAFREEKVLQENIIFHAVKDRPSPTITITASSERNFQDLTKREVPYSRVIDLRDSNLIIHIPSSNSDDIVLKQISAFRNTVNHLNLEVSTGPVVDFRLREHILDHFEVGCAPLIYPAHFDHNIIRWPLNSGKKPNAIRVNSTTKKWLMPSAYYVVIRRFSSKEEKRRIIASLYDPSYSPADLVGFENHLNVIHRNGGGIPESLAKGLVVYLNSKLVDSYFRQFSGHTQVNASDLRLLPVPDEDILQEMSSYFDEKGPLRVEAVDDFLQSWIAKTTLIRAPNSINGLSE